jgi:hypothetical protein
MHLMIILVVFRLHIQATLQHAATKLPLLLLHSVTSVIWHSPDLLRFTKQLSQVQNQPSGTWFTNLYSSQEVIFIVTFYNFTLVELKLFLPECEPWLAKVISPLDHTQNLLVCKLGFLSRQWKEATACRLPECACSEPQNHLRPVLMQSVAFGDPVFGFNSSVNEQ